MLLVRTPTRGVIHIFKYKRIIKIMKIFYSIIYITANYSDLELQKLNYLIRNKILQDGK